jgi:hypothetical protein
LEVLILNNLFALICTEIVQNTVWIVNVANKRLGSYEQTPESKNASEMLALPGLATMMYKGSITLRVIACQAKTEK